MTSQVYSRKWRPQHFRDLAGQEHVVTTLLQAVMQDRVAHSYLFCGPRGTGKTTTARVVAKAVNCLDVREGDPCNGCAVCLSINEGRFLDIIELDAASNRGIDEIRNIRDKVAFAPVEGRRKVYIIDEAHMLTEHASNAFLKTLEEPPAHAIFVLCTTEPHKLLPTIISRCQRFDFRRLGSAVMVERLRRICQEENVQVEDEALQAVARSAGGSLRDAENLLEQLVVSHGSPVSMETVHELLGLGHSERALELVRYLLLGNSASALGAINRATWEGVDLRQLHRQALQLLRGVLVQQWGAGDSLDLSPETAAELASLASRVGPERVAKAVRLFTEVDMRRDAPSPLPLELAVVEVCLDGVPASASGPARQAEVQPSRRVGTPPAPVLEKEPPPSEPETGLSPTPGPQIEVEDGGPTIVSDGADAGEAASEGPRPSPVFVDGWNDLVRALSRIKGRRFNIGALLRDCRGQQVEGENLVLAFAHRSHLERMQQELEDPQSQRAVQEALEKHLGRAYALSLTLSEDNGTHSGASPSRSPLVRYAMGMGAKILEEQEK